MNPKILVQIESKINKNDQFWEKFENFHSTGLVNFYINMTTDKMIYRFSSISNFRPSKKVEMTEIDKTRIRTIIKVGYFLSLVNFFNLYSNIETKVALNLDMKHSTFLNFEKIFIFGLTCWLVILVMFVSEWDFCLWKSPRVK